MANFFSNIVGKFKSGVGDILSDLNKKKESKPMVFPIGEGLNKIQKIQAENKISELAQQTPPEKTNFFADVLRSFPRTVASVEMEGFKKDLPEFQPKNFFDRLLYGEEPIKPLSTMYKEAKEVTKKDYGILSGPLAATAVFGGAILDLSPFGGGKKQLAEELVKETSETGIRKLLTKAKVPIEIIDRYAKDFAEAKTKPVVEGLLKEMGESEIKGVLPVISKEVKAEKPVDILEDIKTQANEKLSPEVKSLFPELPESKISKIEAKSISESPQSIRQGAEQKISESVSSLSNDIIKVEKSKGINVKNLNISKEGKDLIDEATDAVRPFIEQKTGKVLKNKDVIDYAEISSRTLKRAVDDKTTTEWEAALLKTRQKLAQQAETGTVDKDFIENLITIKTIGTDIARKLQSFSIKAEAKDFNIEAILDAVIKATDNADEVINAAKGVNFNNYDEAVKFYRTFIKPSATEWIDLLRYNSMLSSPNTHFINAFSNLLSTTLIAPIEKSITGGIDFLGSKITGRERKYFAGEGLKFAEGYFKVIKDASFDFADTMRGKIPISELDLRRVPLATTGKKKILENVLSYPLKLLEASDRFFMRLTKSGELAALEYRKGKGVSVRLAEKQAEEMAKYRLFRQGLKTEDQGMILDAIDTFTQMIEGLRNHKNPYVSTPAKWTVPFVRTPMNIFKQGIEYSPLGFSTLIGSPKKTEQLSKAIFGSSIALGTTILAMSDRLTFGEPVGAAEKQAFRQAGRQAYSVKIGNKWISYQKLPPQLAFNFAIAAGLKDAWDRKKIDDNMLDIALSSISKVGSYFSDQSYVKSIGDMISALQGGESGIQRILSNYPLQLIPFRAFNSWLARLTDASQRKIDSDASFFEKELQTLMTNFPWLSQKVPARLDKDGTPIPNWNRYWNAFSPVRVQEENKKMEEFFNQRVDFYKKVNEQKVQNQELKNKIKPIYDKAQKLGSEGKTAEAQQLVDSLSDEDYEIYKSIKQSEKAKDTTEEEIRLMPIYQKIQQLKSEGKTDEAKRLGDSLTDKEYETYKKLKNRLE